MPIPSYYATGTASVSNGQRLVAFTDAGLGTAEFPTVLPGDTFLDPAQPEIPPQRIASIDYEAEEAMLAADWPGTSMSDDPYEIRLTDDGARRTAQTRELIERLSRVSYTGLGFDAYGNFEDRTDHDSQIAGFVFLSLDGDGDTITDAVLFQKNTSTSADWSDAIRFRVTIAEILAALGVNNITVSTSDPTGGENGDLWFKVSA